MPAQLQKMLRYKPEKHEIVIRRLGEGTFSFIRLCEIDDESVVIKFMLCSRIPKWIRREGMRVPLEIAILNDLEHPNVLFMKYFYSDNFFYKMVSDYSEKMDLFEYINKSEFSYCKVVDLFKQSLSAVSYIHTSGIVHLDIKDENFLIDKTGQVILIDFGSARYILDGPFNQYYGTSFYEPPEILLNSNYGGKEQDMWQIGVLFYIVLFKVDPFKSQREILELSPDYSLPVYPHDKEICPVEFGNQIEKLKGIIKRLLVREHTERVTATELILDPIFNENDQK